MAQAARTSRREGGVTNVLIVDDSAVARSVIGRIIEALPGFAVGGALANAAEALRWLKTNRAEIILLDIEMPGMDGLTALPELLKVSKGARVLVVSSSADDGGAAAVQALALGAADTLVKPGAGRLAGPFSAMLAERLLRLCPVDIDTVLGPKPVAYPPRARPVTSAFDIVGIGASTGGIHALSHLLRAIPPALEVPILVTQHLPASFMTYFAAQLAVLSGRVCEVATEHARVRPDRILVAPGDGHLRVVRAGNHAVVRISHERCATACMPSVDPMLESLAQVYGARALGVVLSGMGRDGSDGAGKLIRAGGSVVVQDEESCVVWGMPGRIATEGNASAIMPPEAIGRLIASRQRPA